MPLKGTARLIDISSGIPRAWAGVVSPHVLDTGTGWLVFPMQGDPVAEWNQGSVCAAFETVCLSAQKSVKIITAVQELLLPCLCGKLRIHSEHQPLLSTGATLSVVGDRFSATVGSDSKIAFDLSFGVAKDDGSVSSDEGKTAQLASDCVCLGFAKNSGLSARGFVLRLSAVKIPNITSSGSLDCEISHAWGSIGLII